MKQSLGAALLAALTLAVVPTVFAQTAAPEKDLAGKKSWAKEEPKAKQATEPKVQAEGMQQDPPSQSMKANDKAVSPLDDKTYHK